MNALVCLGSGSSQAFRGRLLLGLLPASVLPSLPADSEGLAACPDPGERSRRPTGSALAACLCVCVCVCVCMCACVWGEAVTLCPRCQEGSREECAFGIPEAPRKLSAEDLLLFKCGVGEES